MDNTQLRRLIRLEILQLNRTCDLAVNEGGFHRKLTQPELDKIIMLHDRWLKGELNGARADLSGMDLSGMDLHAADLRYANFRGANLSDSNLSRVDMTGADTKDTNMRNADIRGLILSPV